MQRRTRSAGRAVRSAAGATVLLAALSSCAGVQTPPQAPSSSARGTQASASPTATASPSETAQPSMSASATATSTATSTTSAAPRNDLAKGTLQRSVKSGNLTLSLTYTADTPVEEWTPDGLKPIQVSVSVTSNNQPGQAIYLTRATARFSVNDSAGVLPPPEPVVDTANIAPGYLAKSPYSYEQQFAVPRLDPGAVLLTIQFKYELVTLIDRKNRDYTKQTATDTMVIPLTF